MAIKQNTPEMTNVSPFKSLTTAEAFGDKGVLVAVKIADGLAYKAVTTVGYRVVGINFDTAASGAVMQIREGKFRFANSSTHPVTAAHIGNYCDIETEKIVAAPGTSTISAPPKAGRVVNVDTNGVWVSVGEDILAATAS